MSQTTRLFLSFSSRIADFRHLPPTGVHTERVLKASRRGRAAGHELEGAQHRGPADAARPRRRSDRVILRPVGAALFRSCGMIRTKNGKHAAAATDSAKARRIGGSPSPCHRPDRAKVLNHSAVRLAFALRRASPRDQRSRVPPACHGGRSTGASGSDKRSENRALWHGARLADAVKTCGPVREGGRRASRRIGA